MTDPASVIVHTVSLLAVAVVAGAAGSLHGRLEAARAAIVVLQAAVESLRGEQARDRESIGALRAAVLRLDAEAPELQEPPADRVVGFRAPP